MTAGEKNAILRSEMKKGGCHRIWGTNSIRKSKKH